MIFVAFILSLTIVSAEHFIDNGVGLLSSIIDPQWSRYLKFNNLSNIKNFSIAKKHVFTGNMLHILAHNYNSSNTYLMGVNKFAAMTHYDFFKHYNIKEIPFVLSHYKRKHVAPQNFMFVAPHQLDYANMGWVTAIKDQGECGSCWAFSIIGSLESIAYKHTSELKELSEQHLVDCSSPLNGCEGGYFDVALEYLMGILWPKNRAEYAYNGVKGVCLYQNFVNSNSELRVYGMSSINEGDEEMLKHALLRYGPIPVAIRVTENLMFYNSGVYRSNDCAGPVNHAVLLVGYGIDAATNIEYWKIKNSWGDNWGEGGFFRIERNAHNMCGITSNVIIPHVEYNTKSIIF